MSELDMLENIVGLMETSMLTRLVGKKFQCHHSITIDFDPHLTVLVGATNKGKSAIIRLLRWICFNQPSGDAFISHGETSVLGRLEVDGHVILRKKKISVCNSYTIDGQELVSFGLGRVPDPVADLLNVGPDNFQGQHDSPYWFMDSPGEVSRSLNRVVNLELIDSTLSNLAGEVRKGKTTVEVSQERLEGAKNRLEALEWVQDAQRAMEALEALQEALEGKEYRVLMLTALLHEGRGQEKRAATQSIPKEEVEALDALYQRWKDKAELVVRLDELVTTARDAEKESQEWQRSATSLRIEMNEKLGKTCPVCGSKRS